MASEVARSVACSVSRGRVAPRLTKARKSGRKPHAMKDVFHCAMAATAGACGSGRYAGSSRERTICSEEAGTISGDQWRSVATSGNQWHSA